MSYRVTSAFALGILFSLPMSWSALSPGDQQPGLRVLYTSDILGRLQECGCVRGQYGGLARQASLLAAQRITSRRVLTIDGGNLAREAERALVVLQVLKASAYDAIVLTSADEELGERFWQEARKMGVSLVSPALGGAQLVFKKDGPIKLAIAGMRGGRKEAKESLQAAIRQSAAHRIPLLFVSSECGAQVDREVAEEMKQVGQEAKRQGEVTVILFSRGLGRADRLGKVHLIPAPEGGKGVCRVDVSKKTNQWQVEVKLLSVTSAFPEDGTVLRIISNFFAKEAKRLITEAETAAVEAWSQPYADRNRCMECHPQVVKAVEAHQHSRAVETLKEKERLVPECLTCHSELYRQTRLWRPDSPLAWNGVECATCHGDGILHSQIGTKKSIIRQVPASLCRSCHDQEHDIEFDFPTRLQAIRHWK